MGFYLERLQIHLGRTVGYLPGAGVETGVIPDGSKTIEKLPPPATLNRG